MIAGKFVLQPQIIGRGLRLDATRQRLLHFLQQNKVGVVLPDLLERSLQANWRAIGIGVVPNLTELHVELKDSESAHGSREWFICESRTHRRREPPEHRWRTRLNRRHSSERQSDLS